MLGILTEGDMSNYFMSQIVLSGIEIRKYTKVHFINTPNFVWQENAIAKNIPHLSNISIFPAIPWRTWFE